MSELSHRSLAGAETEQQSVISFEGDTIVFSERIDNVDHFIEQDDGMCNVNIRQDIIQGKSY